MLSVIFPDLAVEPIETTWSFANVICSLSRHGSRAHRDNMEVRLRYLLSFQPIETTWRFATVFCYLSRPGSRAHRDNMEVC